MQENHYNGEDNNDGESTGVQVSQEVDDDDDESTGVPAYDRNNEDGKAQECQPSTTL